MHFEDLNGLDTISCSYSDNGGDTFNDLASGNVAGQACNENTNGTNPNDTAPPGTDRPWVAVCLKQDPCAGSGATNDKLYMVFDTGDTPPNGDAAMSSTDGDQTWQTQCTSATLDSTGNLETCVGGPHGFGTRPGPLVINTQTGTLYEFLGTKDAAGSIDGTEVNISCDGGADWASVQVGPTTNKSDNSDTNDFVVGAIDTAGGLYMAWTKDNGALNSANNANEPWQIFYSHSTDPAGTLLTTNNTTSTESAANPGGCANPVQGGTWSTPVALNGPANTVDHTPAGAVPSASNVNFGVMPWITAGDPGRVDIAYYGSTTALPYDPANNPSSWSLHLLQSIDAQDPTPGFIDNVAGETPMHNASICFSGLACSEQTAPAGDRNLADFFEVKPDPVTGRAVIIFDDDNNSAQAPTGNPGAGIVSEVQQATGPSLFTSVGTVPPLTSGLSQSLDVRQLGVNAEVTKSSGDAILASTGHNLAGSEVPAADVTDLKVLPKDATTLAFVFTVKDLSGGPASAIVAPHTGANWLVTWHWNNDLWFAQASLTTTGSMSYIAGRPLSVFNDSEPKVLEYTGANNSEASTVNGGFSKTANTIEIDVPVSAIGNVGTASDATDHILRGLTAYTGDADAPLAAGSAAQPDASFSGQIGLFDNVDQLAPIDVRVAAPSSDTPETPTVPLLVGLGALMTLAAIVRRRRR
ncbi:MAG: hypothetical protein JOY80_08220 [Candidatus Dormibacteraeota bacterium]|nr:hypothetical protein [Candidatus Dormibacteraeota bacterium]